MNTFKPDNCTLTYRPMSIKNRLRMSVSLVVGFSLHNGKLTGEQEFWGAVQPLLGGCALDEGLPKPHGEFLVAGSCHAPRGKTLKRGLVRIGVENKEKKLAVFGDRLWKRGGFGMTEPLEFSSMALTWERSFGHEFYPQNPLGRGLIPEQKSAEEVFLLPNVEYLDNLVVDSADRPQPASPLPVPPHWPQRAGKAGTYGEDWLKERWPWFPDDIHWEYCNVAPQDQFIKDFFKGNEQIHIFGMHPDHQDIRTIVPVLRPRCFATLKKDPKATAEQDLFREVDMKADTLWLFPDVMTGALVYHGTTTIQDEEFDDVRYFFAVLENPEDTPAPLEEYLAQQWIKAAEVTPNFFGKELTLKEAERVMTALWMQRARAHLEKMSHAAMREEPVMPFSEVRLKAKASNVFKSMGRGYDGSLKEMAAMPPSNEVLRWINRIRSQRDKLYIQERRSLKLLDEQLKAQHQALLDLAAHMPDAMKPGNLDEMVASLQQTPQVDPWHDRGFPLVAQCRERLELDDEGLAALESLGFDTTIVDDAWLGYLPTPLPQLAIDWGLSPEEPDFTIPAGLLLPRFDETRLTRILVLEGWTPQLTQSEVTALPTFLVPGSDKAPLLLESPVEGAPVVFVPGELEARYLDEKLEGIASIVSFRYGASGPESGAAEKLGPTILALLNKARALVVILPKGSRPSESEVDSWLDVHPQPILARLPQGVTLLESEAAGVDMARIVEAHLPPELLGVSAEILADSGGEPEIKAETMFAATMKKMALTQFDKLESQILASAMAADVKPHLEKARRKMLHPEEFKDERESSNMKVHLRQQKKTLRQERDRLEQEGLLTLKIDEKFQEGLDGLDKAAVMIDDIRGALLGKKPVSGAVSQLDNDEIPEMLTREDVILLVRRGIPLEGQDIAGLDLSGLDLSGVNFIYATIDETNFHGSNLSGADFSGVNAEHVDFSSANLSNCTAKMASFDRCIFNDCVLDNSDLERTSFENCQCAKASFSSARFHMSSFEKCALEGAIFDDASFDLSSLSGTASNASFQNSTHFQTSFKDMKLDNCSFARANLNNTRFFTCEGQGSTFYEADLGSAMFDQCVLLSADFRRVKMLNGTISESDVRKADFTGSIITGSLLEKSDFREAQLYGVNAEDCQFIKSDLESADLRGSNFMGASFSGSRLVGCNMRMANCFGAEFRLAVMGQTLLEGAILRQTLLEDREDLLS